MEKLFETPKAAIQPVTDGKLTGFRTALESDVSQMGKIIKRLTVGIERTMSQNEELHLAVATRDAEITELEMRIQELEGDEYEEVK